MQHLYPFEPGAWMDFSREERSRRGHGCFDPSGREMVAAARFEVWQVEGDGSSSVKMELFDGRGSSAPEGRGVARARAPWALH